MTAKKKPNNDRFNWTAERIFGGNWEKQKGEVGIEIEVEGRNLPIPEDKFWTVHRDGSLRGESIEYVLAKPVLREKVAEALASLDACIKGSPNTRINESYRTSVHVHLNVQTLLVRDIYNIVCLYIILEDILTEYAGASRIGNLFCLRAHDAEYLLEQLRVALRTNQYQLLGHDNLRYSGINVTALYKYGSLEFRSFRGTVDPELIKIWANILTDIKDAALGFESPQEIVGKLSELGTDGFLDRIFKQATRLEFDKIVGLNDRILAGCRLIQDVAYAVDWARPDPNAVVEPVLDAIPGKPIIWEHAPGIRAAPPPALVNWPIVGGFAYSIWPQLDEIRPSAEVLYSPETPVGTITVVGGVVYIKDDVPHWTEVINPNNNHSLTIAALEEFWADNDDDFMEDELEARDNDF